MKKWPMLVTPREYLKLNQEWMDSRYFPEKSWLEFLKDKNIRIVNCKNVELNILELTDIKKIQIAKAGVQLFDILRDIIEGVATEAKIDEVDAKET